MPTTSTTTAAAATATCTKCNGCGKLDSAEKKPWSRFRGTPNPDILSGKIQVENCPDCKGTGKVKAGTAAPVMPTVTSWHRDAEGTITGVVLDDGTKIGSFPPPPAPVVAPAAPAPAAPAAATPAAPPAPVVPAVTPAKTASAAS